MSAFVPWLFSVALCAQGAPAAAAPRLAPETPVPIRVVGPSPSGREWHAEVSLYTLTRTLDGYGRGRLVASGKTGLDGSPCVVSLKPTEDWLLAVARRVDEPRFVLGSTVIYFDAQKEVWKTSPTSSEKTDTSSTGLELSKEKTKQDVLSVKIPVREHALVYGISPRSDRLLGQADVWIYTASGKCIRRGRTRVTGEAFDAEQTAELSPAHRKLLVIVRDPGTNGTGALTIAFDHNNWRPATRYLFIEPPSGSGDKGQWRTVAQLDGQSDQFEPIPDGNLWTADKSPVKVPVPPGTPTEPFPLPAVAPLPPEVEPWADSEAAISMAGAPIARSLKWADYGKKWVRGAYGAYSQAELKPRKAQPGAY